MIKLLWKSYQFFYRDIDYSVEKCPIFHVEKSFKIFLHSDPDADDFLQVIDSSLSNDTFAVKFYEDPSSIYTF